MKEAKTKRNDPCPCGSGKKYKKCCFEKDSALERAKPVESEFMFEPGSYGGAGHFMPSIVCKKLEKNQWKYHFVIAKIAEIVNDEDEAVELAIQDLEKAFKAKEKTGSDITVAEVLVKAGYFNINDFRIAQ